MACLTYSDQTKPLTHLNLPIQPTQDFNYQCIGKPFLKLNPKLKQEPYQQNSAQPFLKHTILKNFDRQCPILLPDNSSYCLTVILVPFGGPATLRLLSYGLPKSKNPFFPKTQNVCQRFGLGSKFFGQKTKVAHFCEPLEECKI